MTLLSQLAQSIAFSLKSQSQLLLKSPLRRMASSLSSGAGNLKVNHSLEDREFYIQFEKPEDRAVLQYEKLDATTLDLQHTGVPKSLEGKGIGKILANEAFEYCHQNGFKMKLSCWYLEGYLKRHPVEKYSQIVL